MIRTPIQVIGLSGLVFVALTTGSASAQPYLAKAEAAAGVPLAELQPAIRERVQRVIDQPALFARGPWEEFTGCPDLYYWFLDHPHRAARAWQRLGAPCLEIADRGDGRFGYSDGQGTDVWWETVYKSPALRVWYAEGCAKPGALLPTLPVRAVVVLKHRLQQDDLGQLAMTHQADVFLQTDSRAANLLTRLLGPSIPRMAEQGITQLELFFSVLVGYLHEHPERAERLLGDLPREASRRPGDGG